MIVFLIVACILIKGGSEPLYQGRTLSGWLEDLDEGKAGEVRKRANAVLIEAAGKAAPHFVETLRAKDSRLKLLAIGLAQKQNIINLRFQTARMRREQGIADFSRFRVGAIPVLTNLLEDPSLAVEAARTLSGIGSEATFHLIQALDHTNDQVKIAAALGLDCIYANGVRFQKLVARPGWQGMFPTNAVVAALVKLLNVKTPEVSASAAFALGEMREQPRIVIPALTECLEMTTNSRVLQAVADALGKFAHDAVTAVPSLQFVIYDTDPAVRNVAARALEKIEGRKPSDWNTKGK